MTKEHKVLSLDNLLPDNAEVKWSCIYEDPKEHICDEDMVWIILGENLCIDAGQYGPSEFFRVDVVNTKNGWNSFESSICLTTEELRFEIVRLCWKYSKPNYMEISKVFDDHPEEWKEGWNAGFEAADGEITPTNIENDEFNKGYAVGYAAKGRNKTSEIHNREV